MTGRRQRYIVTGGRATIKGISGAAKMYTLPNFNLTLDLWFAGNTPAGGGPDISGIPGQLYMNSRVPSAMDRIPPSGFLPTIIMRVPTAWRGYILNGSILGTGAGGLPTGWFLVNSSGTMHLGFPNEYDIYVLVPCDNAGNPTN